MERWEEERVGGETASEDPEAIDEREPLAEQSDAPAEEGQEAQRRQYSGVGARVTAVLTAAEKASEQMLTLAREESDEIRRQAHNEAEALVERRRFEGEEEARQRLAQADVEADGIRARAEAEAREVEAKARMRQERFHEETRLLNDRVQWARSGLRDITARLGEVLVEPDFESAASAESDELGLGAGPESAPPLERPAAGWERTEPEG